MIDPPGFWEAPFQKRDAGAAMDAEGGDDQVNLAQAIAEMRAGSTATAPGLTDLRFSAPRVPQRFPCPPRNSSRPQAPIRPDVEPPSALVECLAVPCGR